MSDDGHRYAYAVAVVGDPDVMTPDEVARLLTPGGSLAGDWARHRGHTVTLIPTCGNRVKRDCELVAHADAVVVIGDDRPWSRLVRLAHEARVPVRVYRERPNLPPPRGELWVRPEQ